MTTRDNYYQSAYINDQKDMGLAVTTRQVANGLVDGQVILPPSARSIQHAENIPLIPLTMSEEKTCAETIAKRTIATGAGAASGYFCGSAAVGPVAGIVGAVLGGIFCLFTGPEAVSGSINSCDNKRPISLGN